MEELKTWLLRIILTALICSLVRSLCPADNGGRLLHLLCGVFLTLALLSPLRKPVLSVPADFLRKLEDAGDSLTGEGQQMYRTALAQRIQAETQAYILDKAGTAELEVEVTVSADPVPVPEAVILRGTLSQEQRQHLQQILTSELGITEENQQWIG